MIQSVTTYDEIMRIGLLSDTHGFLDDAIFSHFEECDEVWHAGDFGSVEVLEQLESFKPLRGVFGNIDGAQVRAAVPKEQYWQCDGMHVYMTHIGGYPGHYERDAKRALFEKRPNLFLCGHSHITRVDRDPALGLIHLNPGACGHIGWHTKRTVLRFSVDGAKIGNLELIELGPRGRVR